VKRLNKKIVHKTKDGDEYTIEHRDKPMFGNRTYYHVTMNGEYWFIDDNNLSVEQLDHSIYNMGELCLESKQEEGKVIKHGKMK